MSDIGQRGLGGAEGWDDVAVVDVDDAVAAGGECFVVGAEDDGDAAQSGGQGGIEPPTFRFQCDLV